MNNESKEIERSLAMTVRWCSERIDVAHPASSLRSADPKVNDEMSLARTNTQENISIVKKLTDLRSTLLKIYFEFLQTSSCNILLYFPVNSLNDGLAQFESNGFHEENNAPPWDTWFHFVPSCWPYIPYVLCWIPNEFFKIARIGVDAVSENALI